MAPEASEPHWGLVMPFTVVQSRGGPYDDESFAAGYTVGNIDAKLAAGTLEAVGPVKTALLPQLDLVAMRHGLVVEVGTRGEEWSSVRFVRPSGVTPNV